MIEDSMRICSGRAWEYAQTQHDEMLVLRICSNRATCRGDPADADADDDGDAGGEATDEVNGEVVDAVAGAVHDAVNDEVPD